MKIFAACPECGCTDWIRFDSGGFVCNGCGRLIPGHRRSKLGDYRRSSGRANRRSGPHSLDVPRGRTA